VPTLRLPNRYIYVVYRIEPTLTESDQVATWSHHDYVKLRTIVWRLLHPLVASEVHGRLPPDSLVDPCTDGRFIGILEVTNFPSEG
jgi:hypothetical protein